MFSTFGSRWFGVAALLASSTLDARGECEWRRLGEGMGVRYVDGAEVSDLTVYNGELIAAGKFDLIFTTTGAVSAHHIVRWDGNAWRAFGTGGRGRCIVTALAVYNSDLIAGGIFDTAGDVSTNNIARWDGNAWRPLGAGLGKGGHHWVNAMTVHNGDLIAGGTFRNTSGVVSPNHIARWDGNAWHPLGSGMPGDVRSLSVYNGELIAGGHSTTAGGQYVMGIARWDDTEWRPLGPVTTSRVEALAVYNGELVAGGWFRSIGGVQADCIARWDGNEWRPLGSGLCGNESGSGVRALSVYKGHLVAGGQFNAPAGVGNNHVAHWDGTTWQPLGLGKKHWRVYALTVFNDELIAGGDSGWLAACGR